MLKENRFLSPTIGSIEGLRLPVIISFSLILLFLTVALISGLSSGNLQSVPFYLYFSFSCAVVISLAYKGDYYSPIFIGAALSVFFGLIKEYAVLVVGIHEHRDYVAGGDIDWAVTKKYLIEFFSLLVVFVVYYSLPKDFGFKIEGREAGVRSAGLTFAALLFLMLVLLVFIDFAIHSGGVVRAISQRSLAGEERVAAIIGGHHLFVLNNSYLICLAWMMLDRNAINKPLFWIVLLLLVLLGYFVTGSRGGIVNKSVIIGFAYLTITRKFKVGKVLLVVLPLLVLVGYQSANRFVKAEDLAGMTFKEKVYSSVLGVSDTFKEASIRGGTENSSIGLYLNVPGRLDYQYGLTYASILFIPIPSAILPFEKPSAAGYHYVNTLTGRTDTAWPIGSLTEAFWNFSYFGVVFYSVLMGLIYRVTVNTINISEFSTVSMLIYFAVVFRFSLGSDAMYGFVQMLVFIMLCYLFLTYVARLRLRRHSI